MDAQIKVEAMTAGAVMTNSVVTVSVETKYSETMTFIVSTLSVLSVGNASISAIPAPNTLIKEREVTSPCIG